jgi:hypothetical protein
MKQEVEPEAKAKEIVSEHNVTEQVVQEAFQTILPTSSLLLIKFKLKHQQS